MLIEIRAERGREAVARLASVPGRVQRAAVKRAERLAELEVPRIRARAQSASRLAARVSRAVRARGPRIAVDGPVSVSGRTVPAGDLFFGANWGGGGRPETRQFDPYRASGDYWFFQQLRDDAAQVAAEWDAALEDTAREAGF